MEILLALGLGAGIVWWFNKNKKANANTPENQRHQVMECSHDWEPFLVKKCSGCSIEDWTHMEKD